MDGYILVDRLLPKNKISLVKNPRKVTNKYIIGEISKASQITTFKVETPRKTKNKTSEVKYRRQFTGRDGE